MCSGAPIANGTVQRLWVSYLLEPFQFAGLSFKSYMTIGGIVIAHAPKVGQVVTKIDEIETENSVSIYLL
jgi:hypothetical protein